MVSNVLLTGNTEFLSEEFLKTAFPESRAVITGNCKLKESSSKKISRYTGELTLSAYRNLFHTYEFGQVVYFSESLSPLRKFPASELDTLQDALTACYPETKVIYVIGSAPMYQNSVSVLESAAKEICQTFSSYNAGVKYLISPWVYSMKETSPEMAQLFQTGIQKLPLAADQPLSFLDSEDLSMLLNRIFENWSPAYEIYSIPHKFVYTMQALTTMIQSESNDPSTHFEFSTVSRVENYPETDDALRSRFVWFPIHALEQDLPALFKQNRVEKRVSFRERVQTIRFGTLILRAIELLFSAVICELLLKLTGISVQFNMIDFRLLTVVFMGTMYNIPMGIASAALESLSLALAYSKQGIDWLNLFYEPTNWLPFIALFTVGAVCGYVHSKNDSLLTFAQDEIASLKERYLYLSQINDDVLQDKQEYKQQIIGSRDSFGKIFRIAQQLNETHPKQLLFKAVEVLETILANPSVAIYSCNNEDAYGRLAISSRGMTLPYSMPMQAYYDCLNSVANGDAWVNRALDPNLPRYLYGIRKDGKIVQVIVLQTAEYGQMTLYYENLFRVVCGLISNSLIRAMEYQEAIRETQYIDGSNRILTQESFLDELAFAVSSAEQKQAVHLLMKVKEENRTVAELEHDISLCIRNSDVVGKIDDGYYVLLLQAKENDMVFISRRFASNNLEYSLIAAEQQTLLLKEKAG